MDCFMAMTRPENLIQVSDDDYTMGLTGFGSEDISMMSAY